MGVVERITPWREDVLTGLFTAAICVLLGAPAGLAWSALAPRVEVVIDGRNPPSVTDALSEVGIAADGWFVLVMLAAGLVTGVLAWIAARGSGPLVVLGLALGGCLAGLVAAQVGTDSGLSLEALMQVLQANQVGRYVAKIELLSEPAVLVWPVSALAAFLALVVSRVDEIA